MAKSCSRAGAAMLLLLFSSSMSVAEVREKTANSFTLVHEVLLPENPEVIYDATTGDISGWWDHSFSEKPYRVFIEAKPGGGFYEIFDESGDGVLHATVTWAQRGKKLSFQGPLGLAGNAVTFVWTLDYAPHPQGTKLTLTGRGSGQLQEGWAETIDGVWMHFLVDRLKPFIEQRRHRATK